MEQIRINSLEAPDRRLRLTTKVTEPIDRREHNQFHASDFMKPDLDLYFDFIKEPKTNPATWNERLKWGAGEGVEAQMLLTLQHNGIVEEGYDQHENEQIIERSNVRVDCHIDAVRKGVETPIEIKSTNNKNRWYVKKYEDGYPPENYVGQLGIYMDALGKERGNLFASTVDGLSYFWLDAMWESESHVRCMNTVVDVYSEYERWERLLNEHILPKKMPDIWQYRYKHPIQEINWYELTTSTISKARTGKAVIGDFQVQYSDWKDLIIKLQGETPGYTSEELSLIRELTEGYTTKAWKDKAKELKNQ